MPYVSLCRIEGIFTPVGWQPGPVRAQTGTPVASPHDRCC
jgi:hypothetical protein